MPWTGAQFRRRHNRGLSPAAGRKAARIGNAMLEAGVPEGEAIATANARAEARPIHRGTHMPGFAGRKTRRRMGP